MPQALSMGDYKQAGISEKTSYSSSSSTALPRPDRNLCGQASAGEGMRITGNVKPLSKQLFII